ncbi:hypothetical protein CEUSTIGMA_g8408.t1 [Chlamydomonas eustigma]|uniref:NIPSNAP domain-containing protein n=1 Tax=Chlamydomonas eustigma TaxID=1157962 RepID=A0A250XD02_9CHLO|nr:hypothetical protein CEUSTIGMA_g8408.t1 [Chlamydomonas eustigma]|eukprot:GAX80973.1 hypothetical protein CEUSTIGMA_g8408.t1 [Chlamydomonas eustigma]
MLKSLRNLCEVSGHSSILPSLSFSCNSHVNDARKPFKSGGSCGDTFTTEAEELPLYPRGLVEIREYTLKPEGVGAYTQLAIEYAAVRKTLLPLLGIFSCDVGSSLHRITHMYHYKDFDERDAVRAAAAKHPDWRKFIELSRPHVQFQENKVMLEAGPVYDALKLPHCSLFQSPPPDPKAIYELRSYQMHPGHGVVPNLVEAFQSGLPAKIASYPEGKLVFFGYSDVGMLNNVVELWRFPSAQSCIRARQASRKVAAWGATMKAVTPNVLHFTSSFLRPLPFSPWL